MQGPQHIHCQGVHRRRPGWAATSRMDSAQPLLAADPAFWLPIRSGCIVGTLRSLPYLGEFTFAIEQNLLWVDVSDRPDVFDLGRVLRHEGPGEAACRWSQVRDREGAPACVLTLEVQRPVRTSFGLPFSLPDGIRLLASISYTRSVVLCFGEPIAIEELGTSVAASRLSEMLHTDEGSCLSLAFDWSAQEDLHQRLVRWLAGDIW